jgi:Lon protease-like protein
LSATLDLPLFPLRAVLFPGGALPLKIFEQRYMDMATTCMKDESSFGICLIAEGAEVAEAGSPPAVPHEVGTLARIVEWDMAHLGVLQVVAQGDERFRILSRRTEPSGLMRAEVSFLDPEPVQKIPDDFARLVPLLRAIVEDLGDRAPPKPHRFFDAAWVGYRWCEVLPIPQLARQKLLELEDSVSRLEIIFRFLNQRGLVK